MRWFISSEPLHEPLSRLVQRISGWTVVSIDAPRQVLVLFKTHLDIGFTDLAAAVVNRYFEEFLPNAVRVAAELRDRGGPERFIWTTGSWLIYEYLECAASAGRAAVERAIAEGDLAWHALPFTTHTELLSGPLLRHNLSLAGRLDRRFGRTTRAAKMTDVPGHTRAMIPYLAEAGVDFLHVGVNPGSSAPAVPDLFRWCHPAGQQLLVMYDRGDYGQITLVPEASLAVCFAHARDNEPPQTHEEVLQVYANLRDTFPGAALAAATLDDVADHLRPHAGSFPEVQQEIGDSWIHGIASDPPRVTPYRALLRLFDMWSCEPPAIGGPVDRFARLLTLVPEHTWGLMVESLGDEANGFDPDELHTLRATPGCRQLEASWHEQRDYVQRAVSQLDPPHRDLAHQAIADTKACAWPARGWALTDRRSWSFPRWEVTLHEDGGLARLVDRGGGRTWTQTPAGFGRFVFDAYSQADYERFFADYVTVDVEWSRTAFTKQVPPQIRSASWAPEIAQVYQAAHTDSDDLLLELVMPAGAHESFGAPARLQAWWSFLRDRPAIELTVQWFDKRLARRPTAAWISFCPVTHADGRWQVHKLDDWIDTDSVVSQGGRLQHACHRGVRYRDQGGELMIESLDAAVVAPASRSLLRFDPLPLPASAGMHFCLWNNVWNTNFPLWHDRDERFRFRLELDTAQPGTTHTNSG